ncbi:DUF1205 domain-containing protein [Amycolatopsis acidicola]|uniref:DUF1205 domain-containing protein n=1 Tax=Amycolatopsis acidicola TaxID=2596893 RepID=A0A5N0VMX3_9PSEU|nr:nucleotide disphospho-sugar-binding domain-containing protein [Amycolatopsis acidicola]KAA9166520.1 DUF1205 domain-containing protein [Amycolatopsis acidicola]
MRVLFVVWAWPSHFFPMVPTAWACWTAGHEVLVAGQPALRELLPATGLPAAYVGTDFDLAGEFRRRLALAKDARGRLSGMDPHDAERLAGPADPKTMVLDVYGALARAMTGDTVELAKEWGAEVVVWDPITFAGAIAARAAGARSVRHLWGLDSAGHLGLYDDWTPGLHALLAEHGVPAEAVREDLCLDICPPRLQLPLSRPAAPARYVPYNGPDHGGRALAPPLRPRVCVTWGNTVDQLSGNREFPALEVLRTLAGEDVEVVVAASDEHVAELGALPGNVTAAGWFPLRALLESCTAIVHEGGAGTLLTAALAGVPQLLIPALHEQILAGEQLAASGAGRQLAAGDATEAAIATQFGELLGLHEAARGLRQHILEQPTLADTVSQWV